jgi:hypothetical protein
MQNIFSKAYNETWVENIHNQAIIQDFYFRNLISKQQLENAKTLFPIEFKQRNDFITIGLFLFSNIVIFAVFGLSILLFTGLIDNNIAVAILSFIAGITLYFLLNQLIKNNKFYRSGVDNAILYAMLLAFFTFFYALTNYDAPFWLSCIVLLAIFSIAFIKYADLPVAIGLFVTLIALVFNLLGKSEIGKMLLPFAIMALAAAIYFFVKNWEQKKETSYYADAQDIIEMLALATFYLGGNYYIVREGNAALNHLPSSIQIAFAPLFYFFTFSIPLFYLFWALKKHDRKMLIIGFLAIAFSIFTYKAYFSVLPLEWALTIGGLVLLLVSIFSIKYLKTEKLGLTYKADSENHFQNFESIVAQQAIPAINQPQGPRFEGSDFGGGGGGGGY